MANYNQAPTLHHNGEKENGSNNFYKIPQELADIVFKELGNASAQLRIMLVLIGTKPESFNISDKWICDRTGLLHPSYITARKALVNRGWLTHDPAKGITVNFDVIYGKNRGNTILQNENECSNTTLPQRSNTILPHCSNTVLPQCSNTILPIIDNTDNKKDKIIDSKNDSQEEEGTMTNPIKVERAWIREDYQQKPQNWKSYDAAGVVYHLPTQKFYKGI